MDEALVRAAEAEMRRPAPANGAERPAKRHKHGEQVHPSRFSYNAGDLLLRSTPGFLITCTMKRELSATKEASTVLPAYLQQAQANNRALEHGDASALQDAVDTGTSRAQQQLCPVKVTGSGVVVILLPGCRPGVPTGAVRQLLEDVHSGKLKRLKHCQRILPVEATCALNSASLATTVQRIASAYADALPAAADSDARPTLKYAVAYKGRGSMEAIGAQPGAQTTKGTNLDHAAAISLLAQGFADAIGARRRLCVDLKHPEVVVAAEAFRVGGNAFCALSILPAALFAVRSKLALHPLT